MNKVRAMKKILTVVGARPQFVKASVLSGLISSDKCLTETLVHSGQHFDFCMSDQFFLDLNIPEPKYKCRLELGTEASQIGQMMTSMDIIFNKEEPDLIMVYGDTNTHCGSNGSKIGFLSLMRSWPKDPSTSDVEEINRKVTDHLSQYCFCPT